MSIIPGQMIRELRPLSPVCDRTRHHGLTFGVGPAGYDIRVADDVWVWPGRFILASTVEYFTMPNDLLGVVHDKSTWARVGLAVQNTVIEPGWCGYLTLELTKHGWRAPGRSPVWCIRGGTAIAQVIFHRLEQAADVPYQGKYQNQGAGAVEAIFERSS